MFEKIKETCLKFSQGSTTVLQKMARYEEARVKLTNIQLSKLKSAAKNKTWTKLKRLRTIFNMNNYLMNYILQEDKNLNKQMPLLTICRRT